MSAWGRTQGSSSVFTAIEGEDPRATVALYDRMLHHVFKAGHAGAVFGTIGALDTALWDIKAKAAGQPLWRLLGGRDRIVPAYASGLDIGLTDDELVAVYQTYAERGLRVAKLKGGLDVGQDLRPADPRARRPGRGQPGRAAGPDARRQRVVDPQAGGAPRGASWNAPSTSSGSRNRSAAGTPPGWSPSGRGVRASVAAGENLTGLEQFRPLLAAGAVDVVQTGAGLGDHPLPAGGRAGPRPRPAGQPDRHHPARPGARRDRGPQPHRERAAGPHPARRG